MNILLPKAPYSFNHGAAVVEGNLLYIYRPVDFKELMYDLTNQIYDGGHKCYYCGATITEKQRTMEHRFPADLGGPTLTNNLVPTCKKCNSTKGNLLEDQYKYFMGIKNPDEARAYRTSIERGHRKIYSGKVKVIPEEWICPKDYPLNEIEMRMQITVPIGRGYFYLEKRYAKHANVIKPVVVSANKKLLDGFNVCLFAKTHDCWDKVSIMKLDNVVVMY